MSVQVNRVLFVCHGNICRSVMAHYLLQHMVDERGLSDRFVIDSAACRSDVLGSPIYPLAQAKLEQKGIPIGNHRATKIARGDIGSWDLLVGMDDENMHDMRRLCNGSLPSHVVKAMTLVGEERDVSDPWYTGDFDSVYDDLTRVCEALLEKL